MRITKNGFVVALFVLVWGALLFIGGFGSGQRSTYDQIAELEATIIGLSDTVGELASTVAVTKQTSDELRTIQQQDAITISELTSTRGELEKLVTAQRSIIDDATSASVTIGKSNSDITLGLVKAVRTVDGIIAEYTQRPD